MKKIYAKPVTEAFGLNTAQMICQSPETPGATINPNESTEAGGIESHRRRDEGMYDDHNGWKDGLW